ncbi:MAG: hypothetical protein EOP05_01165 [Proteobacteria bacterium]|nr:MAG: hypothetical protein EOP05_01165 [Pseudomonadota bacterium]
MCTAYGSHPAATCNSDQVHDFIEFSTNEFNESLPCLNALYNGGRSLKEIAALSGFPFSTIRQKLELEGVTFRASKAVSANVLLRQSFKHNSPPPFGFYYLEGRLVKDAKEYPH